MATATLLAEPKIKGRRKNSVRQLETKASLSLRIDTRTRALIDRAAEVTGQTRTDFMVMSARERATEVLLNQTLFRLPEADWNAFVAILDNPPPANAALKKLLAEKAPWER
jgi:uncharacterized protein (DUF1778 family)